MNEAQIRQLVQEMIDAQQDKDLYSVAKTPYHTHNGIDSPKIPNGVTTVTDGVTTVFPAGSIKFTSGATVTDAGNGEADVAISGSGGSPGGSDKQVQFNDSGTFGGDSKLTFDKTSGLVTIGGDINLSQSNPRTVKVVDSTGDGGVLAIQASNAGGANHVGGTIRPTSGNGIGTGSAGDIQLQVGNPGSTGAVEGGNIIAYAGAPNSTGKFGNVYLDGTNAIATSDTGPFVVLPHCAGTPTGVPSASFTATSASLVYDTSANKLWVYNGSWRSVTLT